MILSKIRVRYIMPVFSFLINCGYWLIRPHKMMHILKVKKLIALSMKSIDDVRLNVKKFRWKKDSFKDWHPWIITILDSNIEDDCDGAAIWGKWLLSKIGVDSDIWYLKGKDKGHAICISRFKTFLITNDQFINIVPGTDILEMFNGYDILYK